MPTNRFAVVSGCVVSLAVRGEWLNRDTFPVGTSNGGEWCHDHVNAVAQLHELLAPEGVGVELTVHGYITHGSYVYPGGVGFPALNPDPPRG